MLTDVVPSFSISVEVKESYLLFGTPSRWQTSVSPNR